MSQALQTLVRSRLAFAFALACLLAGCGGSGSNASPAVQKCTTLWNAGARGAGPKEPQLAAERLASAGGKPAALVVASGEGECIVLLGDGAGPPTTASGDSFVFVASLNAYQPSSLVQGTSLPRSWNARPNDDGTLSLGRP